MRLEKVHPHYNTNNFPQFVKAHGNWNVWCAYNGACAAIPNWIGIVRGCEASHFGDIFFVMNARKQYIFQ